MAEDTPELSLLQQILEQSGDAVVAMWAADGVLFYVNAQACRNFGYTREELLGRSATQLSDTFLTESWADEVALIRERDYTVKEALHRRKDGTPLPVELSMRYVSGLDGDFIVCTIRDITDRKTAEASLREALEKERQASDFAQKVFATNPDILYVVDIDERRPIFQNRAVTHVLGYSVEEIEAMGGEVIPRITHPDDQAIIEKQLERIAGADDGEVLSVEFRMRHVNGSWRWFLLRDTVFEREASGRVKLFLGTATDITMRKFAEERTMLVASVFDNTDEGIIITDPDASIVDVNPAFTRITGYTRAEAIGQEPSILKSGRESEMFFRSMWTSLAQAGYWRGELWNRRRDGSVFPAWLTISPVFMADGRLTHYVGVFSDISQIKRSQEKLDHLAHHDPLTDLPNRFLLRERLEHAVRQSERRGFGLAVCFLDLDNFKHVNDSLGHAAGDQLLQEVAERLRATVRNEDTVARIGGDEFVVVLEELKAPEAVGTIAGKLIAMFAASFVIDGQEVRVTASLGVSLYPRDGCNPDALLSNADAAMYRAKDTGRNSFEFYTEELTRKAYERVLLEGSLRRALQCDEFYLVYQPQIDLRSRRCVGVEALLRWHSPDKKSLLPAKFIPFAEACGLIQPIGEWVLRTACIQAKRWHDQGLAFGRVAVNIAGPQIQRDDLVRVVDQALAESELPADRLELEVTESFFLQRTGSAVEQLQALRALGVTVAIDDFGTGYSSLSYLKTLPVNKLKLDKSFVDDLPNDADDVAIATAVLALAKKLDLTVTAEGVETLEQAAFLVEHGCDVGQGYLYGRPRMAAVIERRFVSSFVRRRAIDGLGTRLRST